MKAVSFLPVATSFIQELGLEEYLHGVTFECPIDRPRIVRSHLENKNYSSVEINNAVSEHMKENKNIYYVEMDLLKEIEPDIIFTQHVCNVCQIGTSVAKEVVKDLPKQPKVIPLVPKRLEDMYDDVLTVATELGHPDKGQELIKQLKSRTDSITKFLQKNQIATRDVMVMEWIDPIYHSGHWIPDQITLAGGYDKFAKPGGRSGVVEWEGIIEYDPEVLVIAPCGFTPERALDEMKVLESKEGWSNLKAVQNNEVYIVDGDLFTRPSTTLIDGVELLAALFHPNQFNILELLSTKVVRYDIEEEYI